MPDQLLLRFRNLNAGIDTIEEHNKISEVNGKVLWGWWKKPLELMPDPGLMMLSGEMHPDSTVLLIDSGNGTLHRAPLRKIYYQPGGTLQPPPIADLCPEYYRAKELPAWFEIGPIEGKALPENHLATYVYSHTNRTAPRQSASALPDAAIGQPVLDYDFLDSNVSLWFIIPVEDVGIRERSSIVQPLSRGVWPIKGKYALHLSDLHFGSHHVFRNQLSTDRGLRIAKESLLEALLQDLDAQQIRDDEIALVFVTGDLTWAGNPHEFANALSFFQALARKLGLHNSQIIIAPGNHDIEWVDQKGEVDDNAELNFSNFCTSFYGSDSRKSFLRIHRFLMNEKAISVISLNSCRVESKENAGLGFVGREQLGDALRFLQENRQQDELRIALVHHHLMPVNYIEGIPWQSKSVSITLDAEAVVRSLLFADVRMVFHGHQHQPYLSVIRRIIHGFVNPFNGREELIDGSVAVVGGGSIGVERGHINIIGRNSYNIIDLSNPNAITIRTRLQSSVGPGFSDYMPEPVEM